MSSENVVIALDRVGKCYEIYAAPHDRLKQFLLPRLRRLTGRAASKYFREFWAVRDVSFCIEKGETVALVGRNGSGKSTLLQMICGTVAPTIGQISVHGRIAALLELGAGFNPDFSGRENIALNAAILGLSRKEIESRLDSIIAFSELGEFIDQPVKTYSSGMYVRLGFSIAIHVEPDILIVDEALAVGDSRFQAKCMRKIKEIQERGATILFVSHDVSSVRTLCDRAIWLDRGQVAMDGDVFPVTGRFMEFLFKDEEEQTKSQATMAQPIPPSEADDGTAVGAHSAAAAGAQDLDRRPVTHWGSHQGIIRAACVQDRHGEKKDVLGWGEAIEVMVSVNLPANFHPHTLSVAISIKDLRGTDLFVATTHDAGVTLPHGGGFTLRFSCPNLLVEGKYLLVAAVEDREQRDIHYYEYVEGAHYFSVLSQRRLFGVFHPQVNVELQADE
ncbi:lipopolysaccharide transport system ATP-binding protein [Silvimonas terrae]|uniref:Lipopolysaccharide transport system ATP-binding protein n=1 Tax=Silvimonas terrae TaxID=300266 RepID=A0A840RJQ7_9NEIS|nr:ABC transporter ATP-binding protein [Silvimonas terrae]MBB5192453.1 lipopolysaccharide transport system ATP-binding protein [Silvimonas terrae]